MSVDSGGACTEQVVLVDEQDSPLGLHGKVEAHVGEGLLHRAFVALVFNAEGQLLIAQRAAGKMLWSLWWDNTCASHPRDGEAYEAAGERRLSEELGFSCPLRLADKFNYHAPFQDIGSEREVCATLIGSYNGAVAPNANEVADWKWVDVPALLEDFEAQPEVYTPWFMLALQRLIHSGIVDSQNGGGVMLLPERNTEAYFTSASALVQPLVEEILREGIRPQHHDAMVYQVSSGGKRLRPSIAIAACLALGGSLDDVLYPAASIEVLHNATLITDDIIDHGETRRGLPTVWKKHGQAFAECAALSYTVSVYEGLAKHGRLDLAPILTKAMKAVVDGELLDILFEDSGRDDEGFIRANRPDKVTLEDYTAMVGFKTAEVFAAAAGLGGACAKGSPEQLEALRDFGVNYGLMFQIQDDILDIYGDEKAFGKQIGKDIMEHKRGNAVLLLGLQAMNPPSHRRCVSIINQDVFTEEDLGDILALLESVWARDKAHALAVQYAAKAKNALVGLPENAWREVLSDLVDYCLGRQR